MTNPTRPTPQAALDLIKACEGCELTAYPDPASPLYRRVVLMGLKPTSYSAWKDWTTLSGDPWTIGYGHTVGVHPGQQISQADADRLLSNELESDYGPGVLKACSVDLNENEYSALLSFAYNLGVGNLAGSTLMRLLNAGDRAGAAAQFPHWTKAGGKVLNGLVTRREKEAALFLTPVESD